MIDHFARVCDPLGVHLTTVANFVDPISGGGAALDYVLNCTPGGVGACALTVPPSFNLDYIKVDGRIGIWRSINGRPPVLDNNAIYLIRKLQINPDDTATITGLHANSLLARRIIAYYAGTTYSSKSATQADNQIKAFVLEQLGASISAANRIGAETQADVSSYLTIQANLSLGASVAKAAAWRNLLDVCKELAEASATAGTYLTFEIVAPTEATLELRTYTGQRGVDHRASTGQPVILAVERGNLENPVVVEDYTDEATFIIAAGQGENSNRLTATASDSTRMARSPFGRIERFVDMSNVDDATQLQDEADAALEAGRPVVLFSGDLVETPATTRGIHFDLGDYVTAERRGRQYDLRLDIIHVSLSAGQQRSQIGLRSTTL